MSLTQTPESEPDQDGTEGPLGEVVRTSKTAPITWENYDILNRKKRKILLADIKEKAEICRVRTELIRNQQYNLGAERLRQVDGMLTDDLLELVRGAIVANQRFNEVSEARVQGAHNRNARSAANASKTLVKAAKDMAEYVRLCHMLPRQGSDDKKEAPQVAIQQNLSSYADMMKQVVTGGAVEAKPEEADDSGSGS